MNGKTWKTTHDPWRGISRTSFGLDYLKQYKSLDYRDRTEEDTRDKIFELNHYDDEDDPKYGFDVFTQRIVSIKGAFDQLISDMHERAVIYNTKTMLQRSQSIPEFRLLMTRHASQAGRTNIFLNLKVWTMVM